MIQPKVYKSYTLTGAELALARAGEYKRIRTANEREDATEHVQERVEFSFNFQRDNPKKKRKRREYATACLAIGGRRSNVERTLHTFYY